jgi:hypothetical protein
MKHASLGLAAALFLFAVGAPAHDEDPPVDETPALAAMRYCQTVGVRAAWGAQARFLGAPAVFRYIPEAPLKKMFTGAVSEIPTDAIYVLEDLDLSQRREYEEVAFFGWKQADRWVREGRKQPDYQVLAALFYHGCKKTLTSEPSEHPAAALN